MKTRDDYLESIFEKRDSYIAEQRKKRKTALSFCIPLTACLAVGSVILFGSSRAETAKSLDQFAGSSLNGDLNMEDCQSLGESGQYSYAENDELYDCDGNNKFGVSEPAADAESALDDSGSGLECTSTSASYETAAQNTTSADKDTHDGEDYQMTIADSTKTAVDNSTAIAATTTRMTAMNTKLHIKDASVSVSSDTGWAYSSEKDYSSFDNAFLWAIDGGLDELPDADKPVGEIYTIKLILSDGTTGVFKWSGNSMCDESSGWKTISDSQKRAIELAVNND